MTNIMKKNIVCLLFAGLVAFPATISADDENIQATANTEVQEETAAQPAEHYTTGHVISAGFGFGMSGIDYNVIGGTNGIHFADFVADIRYTYYFFNWMGFTTGIDFSTFGAVDRINDVKYSWAATDPTMVLNPQTYTHILNFAGAENEPQSTWKEAQQLYMLEIPLALSFKYQPKKVGFLGTAGFKLGFPVGGKFNANGTLNHVGHVDAINCTFSDVQGHFGKTEENVNGKIDMKNVTPVSCELFAEAGAMFEVHPRINLSVSLYAGVGLNDMNIAPEKREVLGFMTEANQTLTQNSGMNMYQGILGTNAVDGVARPWNFGIKIAAHFNVGKSDEQRAKERAAKLAPAVVYVHDTVDNIIRDTVKQEIVVRDTVKIIEQVAVKQLDDVLKKPIIYFRVTDYSNPIIEPAYMLDSVASIMRRHPSMRISVEGHASKDGSVETNKRLAKNRAQAVAFELQIKGVKKEQMDVTSYGADHPYRYGDSAANDPNKDRRVEIIPLQ